MTMRFLAVLLLLSAYLEHIWCEDVPAYTSLSGELRKWHKITLGFEGPQTSETAALNPFTDYRLDVTFTHEETGSTRVIPGYYGADGNAANSGATSGDMWLAHFAPDQVGTWTWEASYTTGTNVAQNGGGSSAGFFDKESGSFEVSNTNKKGRDHRGKGLLQYVGEHHLQFAETKEWFLKAGADSPENFLAYEDFDNTPNYKDFRKSWAAHEQDYRGGDPTWSGGKGKGIIGAINYLAEKGMNAFSFIPMNIEGDDRNVFPYISDSPGDDRLRIDVSKTAQWEVLFEHADEMGLNLHFKTQEIENSQLLDGGVLGNERKLYYRELVARFSHHLALTWNIGEENTNTDEERKAFADYIKQIDPYQHHIVIHNNFKDHQAIYSPLLGYPTYDGVSLQSDPSTIFDDTLEWRTRSANAGHKWVVANDEQSPAKVGVMPDTDDPDHDQIRQDVLWANIMAGGAGVEYYFGYSFDNNDLTCEDFRSRSNMWDQSRYALEFFSKFDVPFWEMENGNDRVSDQNWCLAHPDGKVLVVYWKNGAQVSVDLVGDKSTSYTVHWYDPRNGGDLQSGSISNVSGGRNRKLGDAPTTERNKDWIILLRNENRSSSSALRVTDPPTPKPTAAQTSRPTASPTPKPTIDPTQEPTDVPTQKPTPSPSVSPTPEPSSSPSSLPSVIPSDAPSDRPSAMPSTQPSQTPSFAPSRSPSNLPSLLPSRSPSGAPSAMPTPKPSKQAKAAPTLTASTFSGSSESLPTAVSSQPTSSPTNQPSASPTTLEPTFVPTLSVTDSPTKQPTTEEPTTTPTVSQTEPPTLRPSESTPSPSKAPSRRVFTSFTMSPTMTDPAASPTPEATPEPTPGPTPVPTTEPASEPTSVPTSEPTNGPTSDPTAAPTPNPTPDPTTAPTPNPTEGVTSGAQESSDQTTSVLVGVVGFTLVNARDNSDIYPLKGQDIIDISSVGRMLSVRADTAGSQVGSVIFDMDNILNIKTENQVPYSLNGDVDGEYKAESRLKIVGNHTISATAYSDKSGRGEQIGDTQSVVVTVVESIDLTSTASPPTTSPTESVSPTPDLTDAPTVASTLSPTALQEGVIGFTLIDAIAEEDVRVLSDGDTIDLQEDGLDLTIRADTLGSAVSSVVFDFDNSSGVRTENMAPYCLEGDLDGDHFPSSRLEDLGMHTISATAFSQQDGNGTPVGTTYTIEIVVKGR